MGAGEIVQSIAACLASMKTWVFPRAHVKESAMVRACNLDLGEAEQVNKSLEFAD